ncbi:MAG TPA: hypothetical protein VJU87_04155 [Gemmatimonadaceae bacterium]|nr:hypothetical protein [Gemmatimonadaceae bacterium]
MIPFASLDSSSDHVSSRYDWLTPERLGQVRGILLGITLFVGLAVWVFHSLGPATERAPEFVSKLRGVGVLTWIYALVQMLDMRFYHSRFARRRNAQLRLPQSLIGWLFGQMLASFGILYYGLTQDLRWFIAGLAILVLSFWAFPVQGRDDSTPPPRA